MRIGLAFVCALPLAACVVETPAVTPDLGAGATPFDGAQIPIDSAFDPIDAAVTPDLTPPPPAPLFDLPAIRDPATAKCTFANDHQVVSGFVPVIVQTASYQSLEVIDGQLHPITIRGYLAKPAAGGGRRPGVVLAHGLGGSAQENSTASLAAGLDMVVLMYSGPGSGSMPENTSEGLGPGDRNGYRMFDTIADVRGNWFWGHSVAAMRAATCLQARADVDGNRLGMTGFSAGGVATHIAAGADDRFVAAVPQSGVLAWDIATRSPTAWQHALLMKAGLDVTSAEWMKLVPFIAPAARLGAIRAKLLDTDGTTDEFFPLTALAATFDAVPGGDKRLSLAGNFDHGCYLVTGGEPKGTIEDRASLHLDGTRKMWMRHHLAGDARFPTVPAAPSVAVQPVQGAIFVAATVDAGGPGYAIDEVRFWASNDDAFFWLSAALDKNNATTYSKLLPLPLQANTIYYVDVQYRTIDTLDRFALSSRPQIPPGFVPHIRGDSNCQ